MAHLRFTWPYKTSQFIYSTYTEIINVFNLIDEKVLLIYHFSVYASYLQFYDYKTEYTDVKFSNGGLRAKVS